MHSLHVGNCGDLSRELAGLSQDLVLSQHAVCVDLLRLSLVLSLDPDWNSQLCSFCFRDLWLIFKYPLGEFSSFHFLAIFPADLGLWVTFRTSPHPRGAQENPGRYEPFSQALPPLAPHPSSFTFSPSKRLPQSG